MLSPVRRGVGSVQTTEILQCNVYTRVGPNPNAVCTVNCLRIRSFSSESVQNLDSLENNLK